ncbi:MAG: hypothetical protein QOD45_1575 [Pseudonocardiales bacterium]|jgi:hypothetical protein|nr:hypothetical protein [Pseudonocardiales bacterium]
MPPFWAADARTRPKSTAIWLTDVAGLSREEAARLMSWSAQAMLHAGLTQKPPAGGT